MAKKIYTIRVTLQYTKPPIWRRLAVPANITLGQLHEAIQIAMPWTDSHLHQFILRDDSLKKKAPTAKKKLDFDFFSAIADVRFFGPKTDPFGGPLELDCEDEDGVTLEQVCPKVKSKITYEYDFGDSWGHQVEVQKITDAKAGEQYPQCLAGKLAAPPEDCGGIPGFYNFIDAVSDPDHPDHDELTEWFGDDFDPEAFDKDQTNQDLHEYAKWLAKRRR